MSLLMQKCRLSLNFDKATENSATVLVVLAFRVGVSSHKSLIVLQLVFLLFLVIDATQYFLLLRKIMIVMLKRLKVKMF